LLLESLPEYLSGTREPIPQDHSKASFTTRLTRDSGYFDENNPPPKEKLKLMIRAYYPWPGVWTKTELKGEQKRVKFLPEDQLHVQDKNPMTIKDFLNGYPEKREWLKQLGVF
jgi:methionyl-tRNA formyltransferase